MPANSPQHAQNDDRRPASSARQDPSAARLAAFAEAITRPRSVSELIVTLAGELRGLADADRVNVWLFQRHSGTFMPAHGTDGPPPELSSVDPLVAAAWKTRRPVSSTDLDTDSPHTSRWCLPLFSGHRRAGMVCVSPDPGFSDEVGRLISSQAHLAMASTTQFDQSMTDHHAARVAEGRLQRLYQVLDRFKGLSTTPAIVKRIPELAGEMLGYSYAFVYSKPETAWQTESGYADRRTRTTAEATAQLHLSAETLDETFRGHQATALNHPSGDPRLVTPFARKEFAHCAAVPLTGDGYPFVLVVAHHSPGQEIEDVDLELLSLYGRICDNALQNIRLLERLQLEREQAASIVDGTADGIVTLDPSGQVELFNPAMETLTGYRSSEVIGRSAQGLFDPRTDEDKPYELAHPERDKIPQTISIATKSYGRRWVGLTSAPVIHDRAVLVVRDITEQYEFWQRQSEFVSIASHELRTPITAVIGFLSLVKSTEDRKQRDHFTTRAHAATVRLSELVEDLLSVARIEEGRLQLNLDTVAPDEAMQEIVDNLQHLAAQKNVALTYAPQTGVPLAIDADRSKLMQVYANLVDNAIKYTPPGGRVDVTLKRVGGGVVAEVTDTGIGIDQSNLDRVFDKFFREYSELSVSAGGTGLGLFITKELVERQGGRLQIRSEKKKGTTATAAFPASGTAGL